MFTPVLAKHSKNFSLENSFAIGVDRIQRNFESLKRQIEEWKGRQLSTAVAKVIIYQAFIEDELKVPKHLGRPADRMGFETRGYTLDSNSCLMGGKTCTYLRARLSVLLAIASLTVE